jgi:hypothetical protein
LIPVNAMKCQNTQDCRNLIYAKRKYGDLHLTVAKVRQGYKRSSSAPPVLYPNLLHKFNESYIELEVCHCEDSDADSSRDIASSPSEKCDQKSSNLRSEESVPKNDDALTSVTSIMQETSSSEWKCKYHQHSSKLVCPKVSEQTLSTEALDEIDRLALQSPGTRPRDHKAGGPISATLAPPIWNSEDEGVASSCKRIKLNPGKTTRYYHTSALEFPADAVIVSAGDVAAGPRARTLDSNPGKLDVDGDAREKSALSGQGDAPKKRVSSWYEKEDHWLAQVINDLCYLGNPMRGTIGAARAVFPITGQ